MGYKTILTVVTRQGQTAQLEAAIALARREDAHLDVFCLGVDHTQTGYYYAGASAYVFQEAIDRAMASAEALEQVLAQPVTPYQPDPSAPNAPGQLTSHYAPQASLRLDARQARPGELLIGFGPVAGEMSLSESGDLAEAAARLFDLLRRADVQGRPIAVAPVPDIGLGRAINDRLRRAAAPR